MALGGRTALMLITMSIVCCKGASADRLPSGVAPSSANEPLGTSEEESAGRCSGDLSADYACLRNHFHEQVRTSGTQVAFTELKELYAKSGFVKQACHHLTHTIGRAAAEHRGAVPTDFRQGDHFCGSGYHHGIMEFAVEKLGAERGLKEGGTMCADLSQREKDPFYHRLCAHGLGHGFMHVFENDVFASLKACDTLHQGWERDPCYGGVFMGNIAPHDPMRPSKYLNAKRPLYPCTEVGVSYKKQCYYYHAQYVLRTQGDDFTDAFNVCAAAESEFRPSCYAGLGASAALRSINQSTTERAQVISTGMLCMLGRNGEARSNCVSGAARLFIRYHHDERQAKVFCESVDASLRSVCVRAREEYYKSF